MENNKQQEFNIYDAFYRCDVFYNEKRILDVIVEYGNREPYYSYQFYDTEISIKHAGVENCDESPSFNSFVYYMLDNIPA